jgi:hypothetical protein
MERGMKMGKERRWMTLKETLKRMGNEKMKERVKTKER